MLALALGASVPSAARAQEGLPDDAVLEMMEGVRDLLPFAILRDGSHPAPETEAERAMPLVPLKDGRKIILTGFNSGIAEWCGLDWEAHYLGFMQAERARKQWSDKQLAYIGILHGSAMQTYIDAMAERGRACSDEERAQMRGYLEMRQ
ncbi:MAG: hypothetical protein FJX66_15135 [Alphaproteobacteria bacterium]|nr:hypothetical protein [Alphaproteobacteria bacterium]